MLFSTPPTLLILALRKVDSLATSYLPCLMILIGVPQRHVACQSAAHLLLPRGLRGPWRNNSFPRHCTRGTLLLHMPPPPLV